MGCTFPRAAALFTRKENTDMKKLIAIAVLAALLPVNAETVHYITLKFTQSSFTLSIKQHLKDSFNTFYLTLPTTKKFYDSVKVGDVLGDKFKTATFILSGNIGSRKIIVEKKFTKDEKAE